MSHIIFPWPKTKCMYWRSHLVSLPFSPLSSWKRWRQPWAATERVSWCATWATWASSVSRTGFKRTSPSSSIQFSPSHSRWAPQNMISLNLVWFSLQATLIWHLYGLSTNHLAEPLADFGMALPSGWVPPLLPVSWCSSGTIKQSAFYDIAKKQILLIAGGVCPWLGLIFHIFHILHFTCFQMGSAPGLGPLRPPPHPDPPRSSAPDRLDKTRSAFYHGG